MTDDDLSIPSVRDAVLEIHLPPASEDQGTHDLTRVALRRIQAVRLRVEYGWTYERIAAHLGYSGKSAARRAILDGLQNASTEDLTTLRAIENARLDTLHARWWPLALGIDPDTGVDLEDGPDARAAKMILDISARRARLNGTDAPQQVVVSSGAAAEMSDALAALREVVMGEAWEAGDDGPGDGEALAVEG